MKIIVAVLMASTAWAGQGFGQRGHSKLQQGYLAAAYWVANTGNDANTGGAGDPLATIAGLNAADATSNRRVWRAAGGSVWYEALTVPRANMYVTAYGTGSAPLLAGDDGILASAWSADGSGGYVASVPVEYLSGKTTVFAWAGSATAPLTYEATQALCDSTTGSAWAVPTGTTVTVCVHLSDGSNPATHGDNYIRYTRRRYALTYSGGGTTFRGLAARRVTNNDGPLYSPSYTYNVTVSDCGFHCVYSSEGAYLYGVVAHNLWWYQTGASAGSHFVYNAGSATGGNVTYDHCQAIQDSYQGGNATGWNGHTNDSHATKFGTITLASPTAQNLYQVTAADDANALVVTGATVTGSYFGFQGTTYTLSMSVDSSNISVSTRAVASGNSSTTLSVTNSTLTATGGYSSAVLYFNGTWTVSGNTFAGSGAFAIYGTSSGTGYHIDHNTFPNNLGYYYYGLGSAGPTYSDYNAFTSSSGTKFHFGATDYSKSTYLAAFPALDTHSTW
jgi:hypothetical protein